jgi:hypothetical protein
MSWMTAKCSVYNLDKETFITGTSGFFFISNFTGHLNVQVENSAGYPVSGLT